MKRNYCFLVGLGILLIGVFLEYLVPLKSVNQLVFPYTLVLGLVLINGIVISYYAFKESVVVKWLVSVPAAISAITLLVFLAILMGFIHQDSENSSAFGIYSIKTTWYFSFSLLFLLISLGYVCIKRTVPFTKKNIGFLLNHLGLWIVVFSAAIGSNDLKRVLVPIEEGKTALQGYENGIAFNLPVPIKLIDFQMEEYPPAIQLINKRELKLLQSPIVELSDSLHQIVLEDYLIHIDTLIEKAVPFDKRFVKSESAGHVFAAYITISKHKAELVKQGWITTKSFLYNPQSIEIDLGISIRFTTPEAKKYLSSIAIYNSRTDVDTQTVEVNSPLKIGRWEFYQSSYDDTKGKWSETSILEAVYDPWLPFVYVGIIMLLAGSVYLLWVGNKNKDYELE